MNSLEDEGLELAIVPFEVDVEEGTTDVLAIDRGLKERGLGSRGY